MGHRVAECKNPILRNVFCFHCTQRGHLYSECPERRNNHNGRNGNGKPGPRVFALRYEEAPTIDTFAGTFSIASLSTYALVDTGATHSCMSEEFRNVSGLPVKVVSNVAMCVNTPIGPGSFVTKVVESVDVVVESCNMPVDMVVLPMSDFDVVLGMNWLNKYKVVIDCFDASLSFMSKGVQVKHQLSKSRPSFMPTMEL